MRIFVTGATGFIGSAIVPELINAGHQVLGLTRSEAGAKSLIGRGRPGASRRSCRPRKPAQGRGHVGRRDPHGLHSRFLEVPGSLRGRQARHRGLGRGAGRLRPAIAHHLRDGYGKQCAGPPCDRRGLPRRAPTRFRAWLRSRRRLRVAAKGVRVGVMRLPQVHNTVKQGLVTYAIELARQKGVSAYVGDGHNRWPAVHVLDAARLYRLALEKLEAGARYHAVAEEGVPMRDIAEVIGRGLKVPVISISPEEAPAHFGWLAAFAGRDLPASGAVTQERLAWRPTGPGLIADLEQMRYRETETVAHFVAALMGTAICGN